jgi:hypothetical protein
MTNLLAATDSAGIWVLGSFVLLEFSAIIGLYTWVEIKMEKLEKKFVTRELCQQVHLRIEQAIRDQREESRACHKQINRLVDHLIGEDDHKDKEDKD